MSESFFIDLLQQDTPSLYWLGVALLMGVLTSLSPCIYPIIPITVATLGQQRSGSPIALRALLYCLGVALVYTALGATAAMTGQFFGTVASNPYVQIAFANILLLFAFVLKGWIPLPAFITQHNFQTNSKSAFLMGVASGFVAAPCSSPVLAAILLFVAQKQSLSWGISILFTFSVGMCLLLFLAGISSGFITKLPKSGKWLSTIQWALFLLFLIMSEYYLLRAGQLLYL
ncbi:thiol:disulfide interchange protein [Pseudoalteromonas sp. JBTF-M23]|uniref:Thiol:disulfide interchange protein n=1 Tax=Pseudoalteromonas caenipelagi TaxID=2726988 RepID=A0A849VE17_9GAMM|nr:cytochrome c biogenesis protein CcdA [Pseudoalteromonas caenipelagi]NOU51365.1 thiol:disulfide interchange protein [Pseudoalteromonas caenipelagi]